MYRFNIDQSFVNFAPCQPYDSKIQYHDKQIRGLILEVRASGLRTFVFRYRDVQGKWCQYCIGTYPNISTELARRDAVRLRDDWCDGKFPRVARQPRGLLAHQRQVLEKARLQIADTLGHSSWSVNIEAPSLK